MIITRSSLIYLQPCRFAYNVSSTTKKRVLVHKFQSAQSIS